MSDKNTLMFDVADLTLHLMNGTIDEYDFGRLQVLLTNNPEAVNCYREIIWTHIGLNSPEGIKGLQKFSQKIDPLILEAMLEEESAAPAIVMDEPVVVSQSELELKFNRGNAESKFVRIIKLSVFLALAASILVIISPVFLPHEVATFSDSIDAEWGNGLLLAEGDRLVMGKKTWLLESGVAEINYDTNARVVIEAPAKFSISSYNKISLVYGKLYAVIPPEATGFSVNTNNARIVDIGTEFGVKVDGMGDTYLHVLKGKTILSAGEDNKQGVQEVLGNNAKRVSRKSLKISDVPCEQSLFVRSFDSVRNKLWYSQPNIDLADIVGGGDGYGTGMRNQSLDPHSGQVASVTGGNRSSDNTYHLVPSNKCVDGVFVPNGKSQQCVSSAGHIFNECPATTGDYYTEISNTPDTFEKSELTIGGLSYSSNDSRCLFIHANCGITFDLNAIRTQLDDMRITGFRADIGICDNAQIAELVNADFWIVVDGELRYSKLNVKEKGYIDSIDIPIGQEDQFLTIITTDGGDPKSRTFEGRTVKSIDSDWTMFGSPVLVLD